MYQYQLAQSAFREFLERERQDWLSVGMSEAKIYEIHFGNLGENGRGGDYGVWLSERRHYRADHKYAPGVPVAIDTVDPERARIGDGQSAVSGVEFQIDLDAALDELTQLERKYFLEAYDGLSNSEIARRDGKDESAVRRTVQRAREKLKKYFS